VTGTPTLNAHDLSQLSSGASAPAESTPVALINYAVGAAPGAVTPGSSLSGDGKRGYLTGQITFSGIVTSGTVVAQLSTAAHYPATVRIFGVRRVGAGVQTTLQIDTAGQLTLGTGTAAADVVSLDGLSWRITP
jgi:hypothetical protein